MKKQRKFPTIFRVIEAIGRVTFLEIVRDRILYNILVCALLLLILSFLASSMSYIRPERIILDFGLSAVVLSCCLVGVLTGAGLLTKEFERRTLYVALSHPITRTQFLLGKFAGLVAVILVNWVLLSAVYLLILSYVAEKTGVISETLGVGLLLGLIQSIMISSVAVFFSSFSTTSLSVMVSIGLYLTGSNISQLRLVATRLKSPAGAFSINALAAVLPNFEYFNLGTQVTYGLPVSWRFVGLSVLYGLVVVGFLLLLAGVFIQGREV